MPPQFIVGFIAGFLVAAVLFWRTYRHHTTEEAVVERLLRAERGRRLLVESLGEAEVARVTTIISGMLQELTDRGVDYRPIREDFAAISKLYRKHTGKEPPKLSFATVGAVDPDEYLAKAIRRNKEA